MTRALLRSGAALALVLGLAVAIPATAEDDRRGTTSVAVTAPKPSCSATAADMAAATRMAAACDRSVEVMSERTERNQVFVDASGTAKLVAGVVPQRVRRADGSWVPVSTDLVPGADGLWTPSASTTDVRFSNGGSGPLAIWRLGSGVLTLNWPAGPLPRPRIDGDSAVYGDVIPGVDLHMIAKAEGFRPVLEVRTAAAARDPALRAVRFRLGGDVKVVSTGSGGLSVVDASGTVVASSPPAKMWDSSVRPATAGEVRPGVVPPWDSDRGTPPPANLSKDLVSTARGAGAASAYAPVGVAIDGGDLVLAPDRSMLTGARSRLPLFIDPSLNVQRYKWFYARSPNGDYDVEGQAWVGKNPPNHGGDGSLFRSFFQFDIGPTHGSTIFSAQVTMKLDHSYSCSSTPVHLYRVSASSVTNGGRIGWSSKPLGSAALWAASWSGHANEESGCGSGVEPDADAVFDHSSLRSAVQLVANMPDMDAFAVGLCACNSDDEFEANQDRWKRFHTSTTYLIATYNRPPNAPTAQALSTTTDCYAACVSPAAVRTTRPTLRVGVSHAFSNQLRTVFEVRTAASDTATLVTGNAAAPTVSASTATTQTPVSWQVPAGVLVNGTTYFWRARSTNLNNQAGGWLGWQQLTVDTTPPTGTIVNSSTYPHRQWGAAVGTTGTFVFTGSLAGWPEMYDFGVQVDAEPAYTVNKVPPPTNLSTSTTYTPSKDMVHSMRVFARDLAGNAGPTTDHQFWVTPLPNRCWHWALNESSGTAAADAGNTTASQPVCGPLGSSVAAMNGTLSGSVSFAPGYLGNAATLASAGGAISTAGPVLDTTKSFTVMAWVKLSTAWTAASAPYATAVSQNGTVTSRFELQVNKDANGGAGGWCFALRGAETSDPAQTVCATGTLGDSGPPTPDEWVHLSGVYDAVSGTIAIHVMGDEFTCNGEKVTSAYTGGSWQAGGPLMIGRASNWPSHQWIGQIDHVFAVARALSDSEICQQV